MKGGYLVRCGEVEFKIGTSWKLFRDRVQKEFSTPLKAFLEVDVKNALVSLSAREEGAGCTYVCPYVRMLVCTV